jgi:hypothetical protein
MHSKLISQRRYLPAPGELLASPEVAASGSPVELSMAKLMTALSSETKSDTDHGWSIQGRSADFVARQFPDAEFRAHPCARLMEQPNKAFSDVVARSEHPLSQEKKLR